MTALSAVALVTGASGFLGQHVVACLNARGMKVVTLGRKTLTGVDSADHITLPDVGDSKAVQTALAQVAPTWVFHLAGSPPNASHAEAFRVNAVFAAILLDAAMRLPSRPRVMLAGSAAEYGVVDDATLPVTESTPCRPSAAYGISKLAQTHYGLAAAGNGLPVVIARLFNIVGAAMPGHLALGSFAAQIRAMPSRGGMLHTGPLDRQRDFVEASAAARVLVNLIDNPHAAGQVINICSGQSTSLRDYVNALIAESGKEINVQSAASQPGRQDMLRHWGTTDRLRALGHTLAAADPVIIARLLNRTHTPTGHVLPILPN